MTGTIDPDGFCTRCGEVEAWCQCPPLPDDAGQDDAGQVDGDGTLAWFKKKIDAVTDPDQLPGTAARLIEVLARNGMDTATRNTLRGYVKTRKLIAAAEFDRITLRRKPISRTVTPLPDMHSCTPPGWARTDQDILRRAVVCTRVCMGLVGENRAAKLVYLALTSRLFAEPVNIVVKGLSSSGKSYVVECVIRLFPPEAVYEMTAMSERALIYLEESLEHTVIVLYEAAALRENREKADGDMAAYIVRSLLSEGRIEYPVVIRDEDSGQLRTVKLTKPGPTGLITTTTAASLHPENETRMLSVPSNDSKAQTAAVILASAGELKRDDADLGDWHDYQRWLAQQGRDVVIPYASCVATQIPPVAVRLRRDWNTVRSLVKAHALMHQENRGRDPGGAIIASIADYTAVRSLVNDLIADAVGATVPKSIRETVEVVAELETSAEQGFAGVHAVAALLKLERSAASRRLATARDRGYLINKQDKKGQPGMWVTGDPLPDEVVLLPEPDKLCTGPCTHAAAGETAGQRCDCTGVCRCADDADPPQGETYTGRDQP